jgi:hypothetical protein
MEYHKMKIAEINCQTGEQIIRDATKAELAQAKLDAQVVAKELVEAETKAQAKAALLIKLGISESEARLLLS